MRTFILGVSVAGLAMVGCSSHTPTERLESSAAAIRSAEEVGARQVPQAALHLQLAVEQADHAKELVAKGDKEEAASLLVRAQADAELALALAREEQSRTAAQKALDRVKSLKEGN